MFDLLYVSRISAGKEFTILLEKLQKMTFILLIFRTLNVAALFPHIPEVRPMFKLFVFYVEISLLHITLFFVPKRAWLFNARGVRPLFPPSAFE